MTRNGADRFDIEALRDIAGEAVFARGQAYHRQGQVEILSIEKGRVLARVAGTEDYRTKVTGNADAIGGSCSCPAFEDRGFCKHMVATALAANALGGPEAAEAHGALARIREHLRRTDIGVLVEMILDQAERDEALFRRLDMAATVRLVEPKALAAQLKKAINGATRVRGVIDYYEVGGWANGVDEVLDALDALVPAGHAAQALELAEHAIDRIEAAMEAIDDSNGECGALLERVGDIHFAAAETARPDPLQLAQTLFEREEDGVYDTFSGAVRRYEDVLGDRGLAEYRRLASEAWAKLPTRSAEAPGRLAIDSRYRFLMEALDFFAERDGDVDARIALRAKDLSATWDYLRLAEFCLSQARADEALRHAEEGLWVFEDGRPDERLVNFAAGLLAKAGRKDDVEGLLWRAFERAPSQQLYLMLRAHVGEVMCARAIALMRSRVTKQAPASWAHPADLLVQILANDTAFDVAWAVVREHGASFFAQEALARASEATHPREAVEVYAEQVDRLVMGGGKASYEQAVKLLARLAGLRSQADQAAHVAALRVRFERKRNFMKLLG